jgi:hypothetical protein
MAITAISKEGHLDAQQAFANPPPANLNRLVSIFERGICSSSALRNYSQDHQSGYDDVNQVIVYFNAVSKADKLSKAIFDPADGIYHISIEYANDEELLKSLSNQAKVDELFSKLMDKIPSGYKELYVKKIKDISFNEAIKENLDFLKILSERSHKVAVLIFENVELSANETAALHIADGFFFFERKIIEPQKIKFVLMSEKLESAQEIEKIKQNYPDVRFEFVPSRTQSAVPFSYKAMQENCREIQKIEVNINAPDFLLKLTEIFNTHFSKGEKPMFIHATRL